jgi:hypothetical protein
VIGFALLRKSSLLVGVCFGLIVWWGGLLNPLNLGAAETPSSADRIAAINSDLRRLWADTRLTPAPTCDDSTFVRRVSLDLLGRIPTPAETQAFLLDSDTGKREKLVDRMLRSPVHDRHLATFWRRVWLPQTDGVGSAQLAQHFETWFVEQLAAGANYDEMVHRMLTLPAKSLARVDNLSREQLAGSIFEAVSESRPETLAANTTRAFLGLNLDCAQCHNHPFASWSQNQFWEMAAFFSKPTSATALRPATLEIKIEGQEKMVVARYLTGEEMRLPESFDDATGKRLLADWVTSRKNPYLLRHAVNRMWARFCGSGLMEPLDDTSDANPPVAPALLDTVIQAFMTEGLDIRQLERMIVLSDAYQRSSAHENGIDDEVMMFARHPVRGLHGEQLYDSLFTASGHTIPRPDTDSRESLQRRYEFAMRFQVDRAESARRSILQSLAMMNGELMIGSSAASRSPLVAGLEAPFLSDNERIDQMFLAAFSRYPTPNERSRLPDLLATAGATDRRRVLSNLFWAMLNSSEFNTNH